MTSPNSEKMSSLKYEVTFQRGYMKFKALESVIYILKCCKGLEDKNFSISVRKQERVTVPLLHIKDWIHNFGVICLWRKEQYSHLAFLYNPRRVNSCSYSSN